MTYARHPAPTLTDALVGEHGVIYPLLDHLAGCSFGSAEEARSLAEQVAAGLRTHAQIEDDLLFVSLEQHLGSSGGPIAVMRAEHEEIEGTLDRLSRVSHVREARTLALHLRAVAREHFAKEEQVLFPMAEQLLGEEALRSLGQEWMARRWRM